MMFTNKILPLGGLRGFNLFFYFIFHLVGTNKAIMHNLSFPEGVILTISVGWVVVEMNFKATLSPAKLKLGLSFAIKNIILFTLSLI